MLKTKLVRLSLPGPSPLCECGWFCVTQPREGELCVHVKENDEPVLPSPIQLSAVGPMSGERQRDIMGKKQVHSNPMR